MKKDAKGNTSNEKCTSKKNILNYNDEIISAPSTTIAIKKEKLHLPKGFSIRPKEKKLKKIKLLIYMKSINKPEDSPIAAILNNKNFEVLKRFW